MRRLTRQQLEQERVDTARYALGNVMLNSEKLLLIYARQSSSKQYVSNIYSAMEQRDGLLERAYELGWMHNEQWILYVENQLAKKTQVSGSLRIDQRPGLQALTDVIQSGKASAVLVVSVDRITRDEDLITPTQFANLCKKYHVVIITDDYIYDFNNPSRDDMGRFMNEAIASKEYIRKQIKGKMLKNRTRKANMGLVANGNAPVGLMLDATRDNLIPSPHASQVDWLYARYRALDANLTALLREVVGMAMRGIPLFPHDESIDPKSMHLDTMPDGNGWTIKSRYGLRYLLSNPMYAGHLVFNKRIVKMNAHTAIVDADNWLYAFDHLADVDLDGNEIERPERAVRYTQTGGSNSALLSGVRDNGKLVIDGVNGAHVYYNDTMKAYLLLQRNVPTVNGYETSITAQELDKAVTEQLIFWLKVSKSAPFFTTSYGAMNKIPDVTQPSTIPDDLFLTNQELAKVERALRTSADVMDDNELRENYAKKARLLKRVTELGRLREHGEQLAREREQAKGDIESAATKWRGWSLEKRRQFIRLVTDSITLEEIASGWLRVTLVWSPVMGFYNSELENYDTLRMQDIGYIWRTSGSQWTSEEMDTLVTYYPNSPRSELLHLLPSRSWLSIVAKAGKLNVTRLYTKHEHMDMPEDTSLTDEQVLSEFMLGRARVQWKHERLTNGDVLS
jgi:DNA invertase Pin-like site-specific DNA recombinase